MNNSQEPLLSSNPIDSANSIIYSGREQSASLFFNQCDAEIAQIDWPNLSSLKLTDQMITRRRSYLGGSDANVLMSGDAERVRTLWAEKRGDATPPDLSGNLSVALGSWTEAFNRQWYEQVTGHKVALAGTAITCTTYSWRRCTLDGFIEQENAVWEAKHTNAFGRADEVLERYMPQLQHNMAVAKADKAVLSVIFGNHKFEVFEVAADWLYQLDLLEAEEQFWDCVLTGNEPAPAPVPPAQRCIGAREVCLEGNNAWASAALDWLATAKAATSAFKTAIFQAFCIPVGTLDDPDAASFRRPVTPRTHQASPVGGWEAWVSDLVKVARSCDSQEALRRVQQTHREVLKGLSRERPDLYQVVGTAFSGKSAALKNPEPASRSSELTLPSDDAAPRDESLINA